MEKPDKLNSAYRIAFEMYVKDVYIPWVKTVKPESRVKKICKFEHDYDFWLGYVLGQLEGHTMQLFKSEYNREPTDEERFEIEEITQIYLKDIISILKSNFELPNPET